MLKAIPVAAAIGIGLFLSIASRSLDWSAASTFVVACALVLVLGLLGPPLLLLGAREEVDVGRENLLVARKDPGPVLVSNRGAVGLRGEIMFEGFEKARNFSEQPRWADIAVSSLEPSYKRHLMLAEIKTRPDGQLRNRKDPDSFWIDMDKALAVAAAHGAEQGAGENQPRNPVDRQFISLVESA